MRSKQIGRFKYIVISDNIIVIYDNKMLTSCEQKIMGLLLPQPFSAYSVRKISKLIKASYALTYDSIKSLVKKKIIKAEKTGNSLICRLNFSADPKVITISSLIHSNEFLNKVKYGYIIKEIKSKLHDQIYIMILFGSHAKGTATKNSDIDLLFIVQNKEDIEKTRKQIMAVLSSTKLKIEFDVITTEWLVKMFDEKNSVGREALKASIILHGAEQYYTLVNAYDKKRGY